MRIVDLITKKQHGEALTTEEIDFMIQGFTAGDIPDYQMSAMAMAIYFKDMNDQERSDLTMSIVRSGETIDLSAIHGIKVDKHSTGGVGDTTTLVLAPLVASLGVPIAKMSGRGLGHTGGTIDKLEAIPGFHVELTEEKFIELVNKNKVAVVGQSGNLTPADKKLYALRDVTGTVDSIPLIASSIMSKKIASGADAIVLDVKTGAGAFMKTTEDARELAHAMVKIGKMVGRDTMAVISDMSQPLGFAIGNALEIKEAIDTLNGHGPADLVDLCLTLGSQMVHLAGVGSDLSEARALLEENLTNGKALEKFKVFAASQGGDISVIENPELLPQAAYETEVLADRDGKLSQIVADGLGVAAMMLGAGRATKDSEIDLAVGLVLHKKVGDAVKKGDPLLTIHSNQLEIPEVEEKIWESLTISEEADPIPLIHEVIVD
ncbi:MAG: pyrimidine-nucleoside phosphorylase [Carnobacterium sp.]|uniref:Pyrimidine-nucleoside phosphorylase n=1 Tax=Carnobacterium antarcticum TaxID=2126436 RepID=A0ABW4NPD6_9LACT|nr:MULTISPECIES: pyrimidine-nucleoside phosphorylase [unclassified Carnobacterium]ALV21893.1 Pyrimidine-nucleoside phosphorylase [Carnobacterium sp. CP1]QQP69869.1 pyrimidine-nucleoside phosphorylase [Carnobacterium sp. CS13]